MAVEYEWDIETIDEYEDVVDHWHERQLRKLPDTLLPSERLVLVRTRVPSGERSWAYADGDSLSGVFRDSYDRVVSEVPAKYMAEFEARVHRRRQRRVHGGAS